MAGLALRAGSLLVRIAGGVAGWLALALAVLGVLGVLSFETVEEATCGYDPEGDGCLGPEWIALAVLVGAIACLALAIILLPLWLVHRGERARRRRGETLHTPRLHALDGWLMAGQVAPDRHASLKARLQQLLARTHAAQLSGHAGLAFAAFTVTWLVAGVAGGLVAGLVGIRPLAAAAWLVAGIAGLAFALAVAATVAGRRAERQAWGQFERDWDATLHDGAAVALRPGRKAPASVGVRDAAHGPR